MHAPLQPTFPSSLEFSAVSHFQKRKVVDLIMMIVVKILFYVVNIYVAKIGYAAKKSHT